MTELQAVLKAKKVIGGCTPIKADCGKLCSRRCCRGGPEAGMLIFPGERDHFENDRHFSLTDSPFAGEEAPLAVCRGSCRRSARPLSCRIFPLVPYITESGIITVINDPRAAFICPLLRGDYIDAAFRFKTLSASVILCKNEVIYAFLSRFSRILDEYKKFTGDLL